MATATEQEKWKHWGEKPSSQPDIGKGTLLLGFLIFLALVGGIAFFILPQLKLG